MPRTILLGTAIAFGVLAGSGPVSADPPTIEVGRARRVGQIEVTGLRWVVPVADRIVVIRGWGNYEVTGYAVGARRLGEPTPVEGLVTPEAGLRIVTGTTDGLLLVNRREA